MCVFDVLYVSGRVGRRNLGGGVKGCDYERKVGWVVK